MVEQAAKGATSTDRLGRWRKPLAYGLIILAAVVLLVASLTVWVREQALDTEAWTEASSELLRDETIRHQLAVYLVDSAIDEATTNTEIAESIPPALRPLAGRLAASVRTGAINTAEEILARPAVIRTWEEANRIAHGALIRRIERDEGTVVLDLGPVATELRTRLGLVSEAQPDAGQIVIVRDDQLDQARTWVKAIRALSFWAWILVVALGAVGFWLARGFRRSATLVAGASVLACGLLILLARRIAGNAVSEALTDGSQVRDSADAAWLIATTLLVDTAAALIAFGVLALIAAWIAGPSRSATSVRSRVAPLLAARPAAVYTAFALLVVLVLVLLPDGNRRWIGTLVIGGLMFAGLELLRRMTLREFPQTDRDAVPTD